MKKYYYTLNKDQKNKIKNIYQKDYHKSNLKVRLTRLLIYSILGYMMSILLYIDAFINKEGVIFNIIIATTLLIVSTIFLIGRFKVKEKVLNNIALKNK